MNYLIKKFGELASKGTIGLIGVCVLASFVLYGCKDNTVSIDTMEPKGSITGIIVDKSTGEPLSSVEVTLTYANPDTEDEEQYVRSTDDSGRFIFKDIPVNGSGGGFSMDLEEDDLDISLGSSSNFPYSLMLDMSGLEGYRSKMLFDDIRLNFATAGGLAGGAGAADELVSSVVIPVGKLNSAITGKVITNTTNEPVANATVQAFLEDGYEGFDSSDDILIQTGDTGSDGSFTLNSLDEGADVYLRIVKEIDEDNRVNMKTPTYELLASANGESAVKDVGNISVTATNSTSSFYISDVSVENGSLVNPDEVMFEMYFNKPVKQTPYTSTEFEFGLQSGTMIDDMSLTATNTRAKIGAEYELSAEWNESFDRLTVNVIEELPDGFEFLFDVAPAVSNFTDAQGNTLVFGVDYPYSSMNDAVTVSFATEGNTEVPSVPQLFANYNQEVDYTGTAIELISVVDESVVEVAYLEVYQKVGDDNFTRIQTVDDWFADQIIVNTTTGLLVQSRSGGVSYDEYIEVSYKVRAVSVNLRRSDFSDVITISDVMGPRVIAANYTTIGAPAGNAYIDIELSEPMRFQSSGGALFNPDNYIFRDNNQQTKGINDVIVDSYDFDNYIIRLEVPDAAIDVNIDEVVLSENIVDLAGNGVSKDGNDDAAIIQ
ncbi:MAG: carboxypeptidase-like regulatory domain-containing protein [Gracilimonas sp.]